MHIVNIYILNYLLFLCIPLLCNYDKYICLEILLYCIHTLNANNKKFTNYIKKCNCFSGFFYIKQF